jgi:hypothetical protein
MATGSGIVYDGELTVYSSQNRTTSGFLDFLNVTAGSSCFAVTVTGFVAGHIDIDFLGSLDGTNFGYIAAATKHTGAQRVSANGTYLYFIQDRPVRDYRFEVVTITDAGPTITVTLGSLSDG